MMTVKELVYSCNNIRPGTIVLIKLKSVSLSFEGMYDIPFALAKRSVKKFELFEHYVKIWLEDRI